MAVAKKATLSDAKIKILVWGDPGAGKSRFGLSAPNPLVIDLEGSTRLYSNEFDFYVAEVNKSEKSIDTPIKLTATILGEILSGEYKDRKTLVIDPITDLLDNLEAACANQYEKMIGKSIDSLNQLQKTKWYAFRRDKARDMLNQLKDVPMNLVLISRAKNVWGTGSDGKTQPVGQTYDSLEIVEYLMDVVIHLQKNKQNDIQAIVKKSRLGNLPDILEVKDWTSITKAIESANKPNLKCEVEKISKDQVTRLHTLSKANKSLVDELIKNYGYSSSKDILVSDYNEICHELEVLVNNLVKAE